MVRETFPKAYRIRFGDHLDAIGEFCGVQKPIFFRRELGPAEDHHRAITYTRSHGCSSERAHGIILIIPILAQYLDTSWYVQSAHVGKPLTMTAHTTSVTITQTTSLIMTVRETETTPVVKDLPPKPIILDGTAPKKEPGVKMLPGHLSIPAQPYAYTFHPAKTALVIIDMQRDFLLKGGFGDLQSASQLAAVQKIIPATLSILQACRKAGVAVIHTREGHEPSLLDCPLPKLTRQKASPTSTRHTLVIGQEGAMGRLLVRGEYGHDIVDELQPLPGELVVDKPGKGAFYNTAFQEKLIGMGITHLIVAGVTVECCVTTTAREGTAHV